MTAAVTVPLALDDFVPVLLAGVGAFLLAVDAGQRAPAVRRPALLGAALITAAGLAKASWKLALATTGDDIAWLADGLFVLLAPGFALLAWSLLVARGTRFSLAVPFGLSLAAGGAAWTVGDTWPLLVLAVIGATATSVLAILRARSVSDTPAALLFGLQLVMAYALVPLAGDDQSVSKQWWEQSLNTVGQGAFALGAWRLLSRATTPAAAATAPGSTPALSTSTGSTA